MRRTRVAVLVSAVLLVAACTDEVHGVASPEEPTSSSTSPPPSSAPAPSTPAPSAPVTPIPSPTDESPPGDASFPADTEDEAGPAQAGADDPDDGMHVDGLRLSSQNGFTRLVVDLSTDGVPEWTVGYSEPSGPGGGPVEISGDAFLRVQLRTEAAPGGQSTSRIRTSPGPVVEALTTGFFEGYEEILVGIDGGEQPFRAFALTDPGRLVIDVRYG